MQVHGSYAVKDKRLAVQQHVLTILHQSSRYLTHHSTTLLTLPLDISYDINCASWCSHKTLYTV